MSGGMDSSFAAYVLKEKGYEVVGFTFQLLPASIKNVNNPKACCSIETVARARKVADDLGIRHYVINLREEFQHFVIDRFIAEYREGRTPNPCILCNQHIKFSAFLDKALSIGADKVATGHYAIIDKGEEGGWRLRKSRDQVKDQSYFLYPIKKEALGRVLFPLGGETKEELKAQAGRLINWDHEKVRESQDICFVPESDYREFLAPFVPVKRGRTYFVDGTLLGHHDGVHLYTIGQRRGPRHPLSRTPLRSRYPPARQYPNLGHKSAPGQAHPHRRRGKPLRPPVRISHRQSPLPPAGGTLHI